MFSFLLINVEMEKVSIVITMYNCELTIKRLLETVIKQTYKNLEIILIDDGSTDNTLSICEKYKDDKRLKIVKQKNSGVSSARNLGIREATGQYIFFSDSDDYLDLRTIEKMVKIYKDNKFIELVVAGFYSEVEISDTEIYYDKIYMNEKMYRTKSEIKEDFVQMWDKHMLYNIWNKLYLTNIIKKNNICFPNYNWGEDIQFNREYLLKISSMYITNECLYHYVRAQKTSITERYKENLFQIRKKEYDDFCNYFDLYRIPFKEYEEFVSRRHAERLLGCVENLLNIDSNISYKEKRMYIKEIVNDELTQKTIKKSKFKSRKMKILMIPFFIKNITLILLISEFISCIKRNNPVIFYKLKNRR